MRVRAARQVRARGHECTGAIEDVARRAVQSGNADTERLRAIYGPDGPSTDLLAQISVRRVGTPAEIAATACFLASSQAAYVTGAIVPVDGGLLNGLS